MEVYVDIRQAAEPLASVSRPCIERTVEITNKSDLAANRILGTVEIMMMRPLMVMTWQARMRKV